METTLDVYTRCNSERQARMRLFLLVVSVSMGVSGILLIASVVLRARPDLRFHPKSIIVQQAMPNRKYVFQVAAVNSFAEPVQIERIHVSCGCMQATVTPSKIAPGADSVVDVGIQRNSVSPFTGLVRLEMRRGEFTDLVYRDIHVLFNQVKEGVAED